jgi:hypothetical protein
MGKRGDPEVGMAGEQFIERLLEDEGVVGALDDTEASLLVETLTDRALRACQRAKTVAEAEVAVGRIRQFGRDVSEVVSTWRDDGPDKAAELAKRNKLPWPPTNAKTPADVLRWFLQHTQPV